MIQKKWKCVKEHVDFAVTIGEIYNENEFGYITDDNGRYDINPLISLCRGLFEEVE